jgi:hypothetical protein
MEVSWQRRVSENTNREAHAGSMSAPAPHSVPAHRPSDARCAWLCVAILALAGCASSAGTKVPAELIGDWQYIRTAAWLRIAPDGRVFQCRHGRSGNLFRAVGRLNRSVIEWEQVWEPDDVARRGEALVLTGPYGSFVFARPLDPLPAICEAPF